MALDTSQQSIQSLTVDTFQQFVSRLKEDIADVRSRLTNQEYELGLVKRMLPWLVGAVLLGAINLLLNLMLIIVLLLTSGLR